MKREFIFENSSYKYNIELDEARDLRTDEIVSTDEFLDQLQLFVKKEGFTISVFGYVESENYTYYECKIKDASRKEIFEAFHTSIRAEGIIECFDWLIKKQKIKDKVYSLDGTYYYDYDEVYEILKHENEPERVFMAEKVEQKHEDFIDIDYLLEAMQEKADEKGEWAEGYLNDVTKDQKEELSRLVLSWLESNVTPPSFFLVENIKEISQDEFKRRGKGKYFQKDENIESLKKMIENFN